MPLGSSTGNQTKVCVERQVSSNPLAGTAGEGAGGDVVSAGGRVGVNVYVGGGKVFVGTGVAVSTGVSVGTRVAVSGRGVSTSVGICVGVSPLASMEILSGFPTCPCRS